MEIFVQSNWANTNLPMEAELEYIYGWTDKETFIAGI